MSGIVFNRPFFGALRGIIAFEKTLRVAYNGLVELLPPYEGGQEINIDPKVQPLALNCIDEAYALKQMLTSLKIMSFADLSIANDMLNRIDRIRATVRHPEKHVSNKLSSGKSLLSGIRVWYGTQGKNDEWQCRMIMFSGIRGKGQIGRLQDGFHTKGDLKSEVQIVFFVGNQYLNLRTTSEAFYIIVNDIVEFIIKNARGNVDEDTMKNLERISNERSLPYLDSISYALGFPSNHN